MKEEFVAGIVLGIIGLVLLLVPSQKLWDITEKWKTKGDGQPSQAFATIIKIVGIVFAAVGIVMMITGWD